MIISYHVTEALWQMSLKFPQWFSRKRFLNLVSVFLWLRHYISLEKGVALQFNKFTEGYIVPSLIENGQVFLTNLFF